MSLSYSEISIRPGALRDVPEVTGIFVERYHDTTPTIMTPKPAWVEPRIKKYQTDPQAGHTLFAPQIMNAHHDPARFLFLVAVDLEDYVVGFTAAAAESDEGYASINGLVLAPGYDGMGIASRLESERQDWAHAIGRVLRGQIVSENQRSREFFTHKGYREVGQTVMENIPVVLVEHNSPLTTLATPQV